MDNIERFLRSLPLFSSFSDESMKQLLESMTIKTFPPGEVMIRLGRPGSFLGVILDGEAEAVKTDQFGRKRVLGKIRKGEYFGEMSLMTGEPTCADVIAHEECQVALIPADVFSKTIAANPNAVRHLAKTISRRLVVREEDPEERELVRDAWRNAVDPYGLKSSAGLRPMKILILECGGDSMRYSYFDMEYEANNLKGRVDGIGADTGWHRYLSSWGEFEEPIQAQDYGAAFDAICEVLTRPETGVLKSIDQLTAVGHKVRWGGEIEHSLLIDDELIKRMKLNLNLAPPQNRDNLAGIEQIRGVLPDIPQIAIFETSYHHTVPPYAYLYGIPYEFYQADGLRRYGAHGLAHNYAALKAATFLGRPFRELKLITCYLDEATSVCAVDHGRSIDTGLGLMMDAEYEDLDPAVILYLLREKGLSPDEIDQILSKRSGLKGISGREELEEIERAAERGDQRAILAIHMFCYRAKKHIGAYIAALGGLDALIFTGDIGERDAGIRARICQGLSYMGIILDEMRNRNPVPDSDGIAEISDENSRVRILIVPADEFRMAAVESARVLEREDVTGIIKAQPQVPIPIGVSARHVHLSRKDLDALFGEGYRLTPRSYLSQPGQYACEETVNLIGPKGRIERVRILGPLREETQVEIARTDQFRLGIDAPIRASGDLDGTPGITIEGPKGTITIPKGVICSVRHIHMSPEDALRFGLRDTDIVMIRVEGERPLIFGDVLVRVKPNFRLDMHIDTDEANAAGITTGMVGYLEAIQSRK
jgi:acetate kinase